jgi:hypothetical protein
VVGMAANPSGAHQAGRVFAGRIDVGGVSACRPRAGTPEVAKAGLGQTFDFVRNIAKIPLKTNYQAIACLSH